MTRDKQKRLINRLRGSLIATSVIGSLGLAGYLGATTQAANTSSPATEDSTTTSDDGSRSAFTDTYGGGIDVHSGSGPAHATTSGS